MKRLFCLLTCFSIAAFAQDSVTSAKPLTESPKNAPVTPAAAPEAASLTKFDLNFKGGTPKELVDAISAAIRKPLNVIIPSEYQDQKLPPFNVKQVNVSELFAALSNSSRTQVHLYNMMGESSYAFVPEGSRAEDSIWYFTVNNQLTSAGNPNFCKLYLLTPYLEAGLTVDDITTAIRTGWKMLNNPVVPQMSFHKETQLLIATGDAEQIGLIDQVLGVLKGSKAKGSPTTPPSKNDKT